MKKDSNCGTNTDGKLLSRHKKILEAINSCNDFYEVYNQFNITEEDIKIWRKTIPEFNDKYLKAIGLTKIQERFLETFAKKMLNISAACKAVHIHRSTYYEWVNKSDTFKRLLDEVSEGLKDDVETVLLKKIFIDKNGKALEFFAKSKISERGYGKAPLIVNNEINNRYGEFYGKTLEELDAEIEELEKKLGIK